MSNDTKSCPACDMQLALEFDRRDVFLIGMAYTIITKQCLDVLCERCHRVFVDRTLGFVDEAVMKVLCSVTHGLLWSSISVRPSKDTLPLTFLSYYIRFAVYRHIRCTREVVRLPIRAPMRRVTIDFSEMDYSGFSEMNSIGSKTGWRTIGRSRSTCSRPALRGSTQDCYRDWLELSVSVIDVCWGCGSRSQ